MEPIIPDTQSTADEVTRWQLKWGTPQSLWVSDLVEVRGFGRLAVDVIDSPRLTIFLGVQDELTLVETAHVHLKAMAVQALQDALYKQHLHSFPDDSGALPPETIEQLTADVSAGLHVPLAEMGLALYEFAIEGGSYHYVEPQPSHLQPGGDESPPPGFDTSDVGLRTPSVPPEMLSFTPSIGDPSSTDISLETLTSAQVADSLKITEVEVIQLIESGQLNALKIGAEYRILKEWVEEYL
jgi:excisionase family DNA binding protein